MLARLDATHLPPCPVVVCFNDHQIVDGSDAVRFLVTIKTLLEDPENLLLEG